MQLWWRWHLWLGRRRWRSLAQFGHQTHVLLIDLGLRILASHARCTGARTLIATIFGQVASAAARGAHNGIGDNWFIWALPRLVICGAAGATLYIVLTECAIELRQLTQLHATQIIVTLGHFNALPNDILNLVHSLAHRLRIGRCDEGMQRFILPRQRLTILATHFSLLDRTLAAYNNLGSGVLLHGLERITTWTNQETHKIDVRMLLLWYQHLIADPSNRRPEIVKERRIY